MIDMNTKPLCCPLCGGLPQSHTSVPLHYYCSNEKCELYMIHVWHERWNRRLGQLEKMNGRWNADSGSYNVVSFTDVEEMLRS